MTNTITTNLGSFDVTPHGIVDSYVHTIAGTRKETEREWLYRMRKEDAEAFAKLPKAERDRMNADFNRRDDYDF